MKNIAISASVLVALLIALPADAQVVTTTDRDLLTTAEAEGFAEWRTGVRTADLDRRFEGTRRYTVFAPTDAAFRRLSAAERARLRDPAVQRRVYQGTIVEGPLTMAELREREFVTTIDGRRLPVHTMGDRVMIGDATVEREAIRTEDGTVFYAVDRVTLPPAAERVRK